MQQPNLNYYTIIPDGILKDQTLTDTDFKTLIVIYSLTRVNGYCNMSNAELSKFLGNIQDRPLQKRIAKLIDKKFLIRVLEEHHWGTLRKLYMPEKFFAEQHQNPENVKKRHSPALPTDKIKTPVKTYKNDFREFVKYVREMPFPFEFTSTELEGVPHAYKIKGRLITDETDNRVLSKDEAHSLWKYMNSNAVKPKILKLIEAELLKREGF